MRCWATIELLSQAKPITRDETELLDVMSDDSLGQAKGGLTA